MSPLFNKMRIVKHGPGSEVFEVIKDPIDLFIIIIGETITFSP
jgi:hypothetical protein